MLSYMEGTTSTLRTLNEIGEARPFPRMTAAASTRRWALLVRVGTVPPGVVVRFDKRIFLDIEKLDRWVSAGGTAARPAASGPEQPAAAV
jgi:hypothetical protein